jgi:hypothetical protein
MSRFVIAGAVAIFVCGAVSANAENVMSMAEAQAKLEHIWGKPVCGARVPLGEYKFATPEAAQGGQYHAIVLDIDAFKKAGVVKTVDLPGMLGMAHFRVELSDTVNPADIVNPVPTIPTFKCVKFTNDETQMVKVIKVQPVKGGRTKWDGALIYGTLSVSSFTDLYRRVTQFLGFSTNPVRKFRALFRYDPFKNDWSYATYGNPRRFANDVAPIDSSNFPTNNVGNALYSD